MSVDLTWISHCQSSLWITLERLQNTETKVETVSLHTLSLWFVGIPPSYGKWVETNIHIKSVEFRNESTAFACASSYKYALAFIHIYTLKMLG